MTHRSFVDMLVQKGLKHHEITFPRMGTSWIGQAL